MYRGIPQDSGYGLCSAVMKDCESQEQESEKADNTGYNRVRKEEREDGTDELLNTHGDPQHRYRE